MTRFSLSAALLSLLACTTEVTLVPTPTPEPESGSGSESDTDTDTDAGTDLDVLLTDGPVFLSLSLIQVVEIPVVDGPTSIGIADREAPLIAGRDARAIVLFDVPDDWTSTWTDVIVEVTHHGVTETFDTGFILDGKSMRGEPGTGLVVDLPAAVITPEATWNVSIVPQGENTPSARFPAVGDAPLAPEETGPIAIHLVPYQVNGFTPDTSQPVLDGFRDAVLAVYPTTEVQLTVGDVRTWPNNNLGDILVDVGVARDTDLPADHVYYYGLVDGVETRDAFSGITGSSENGGANPDHAYFAVGAAFGDALSESTLVHELGHLHQLEHAPCGDAGDVDPDFPDPDGLSRALGYDFRDESWISPETADLMGYCQPRWISPYHYRRLADWIEVSQTW